MGVRGKNVYFFGGAFANDGRQTAEQQNFVQSGAGDLLMRERKKLVFDGTAGQQVGAAALEFAGGGSGQDESAGGPPHERLNLV